MQNQVSLQVKADHIEIPAIPSTFKSTVDVKLYKAVEDFQKGLCSRKV
jgi:hypothetical protein